MPRRIASTRLVAFALFSISIPSIGFAGVQVGTLTQIEGEVVVFSNPSKHLQTESDSRPHALFEGEYYYYNKAKIGDRVEQGNILRTALQSKARVVFDNGDQFNVGPGTSYRVSWNKDSKDANTKVKLMYGKLRGIIEKGGPRSRLQVRTKAATMGVRGTDFYIADNGVDGETEISIMRGSVEVKAETPAAKPIEVKSGYSATIVPPKPVEKPAAEPADVQPASTTPTSTAVTPSVAAAAPAPLAPAVELRRTTQEDLLGVQKASYMKKAELTPAAAEALPKEVLAKVKDLEVKAVETTLNDVKTHDPKLYAQLQEQKVQNTEQINTRAVEVLFKEAPKAPPRRKPSPSDLEDLERGAYEKYFRILE
ncbi:MAG TPA: FecR family protein [Bdellovibrionota bacterium]|nr:FecR family protein [Bdellovibrionota bacterium]